MAVAIVSNKEALQNASPSEGRDLEARACVHAFMSKITTSTDSFSFNELAQVGDAVGLIKREQSDPKLLRLYNGLLLTDQLRAAVTKACELNSTLSKIKSTRDRCAVLSLATSSEEIAKKAGARFQADSLPAETTLYRRYEIASKNIVGAVTPQKFGQLVASNGKDLAVYAKLVELTEAGGAFSAAEMGTIDVGMLEGRIIRARRELTSSGGDLTLASAKSFTDTFDPLHVRSILGYARRLKQEIGAQRAALDLKDLAEFAQAPDLRSKTVELVAHIAKLCEYDQTPVALQLNHPPIEGIGKMIGECIEKMRTHCDAARKGRGDTQAALRGLNGFLAESRVACRLLDKGWQIVGLDREVPKEIDIVARKDGRLAYIEVKDNWSALGHSFEGKGTVQLQRHAKACDADSAIPILIIENAVTPHPQLVDTLNQLQKERAAAGKPIFLIREGHFNKIDGVRSA